MLLILHQKYLPADLKGKGEPSYSIEKALKEHKHNTHRRIMSDGESGYEMQPQARPTSTHLRSASGSRAELVTSGRTTGNTMNNAQYERSMQRSNTTGKKFGEGLKKRFGSLRRSKNTEED